MLRPRRLLAMMSITALAAVACGDGGEGVDLGDAGEPDPAIEDEVGDEEEADDVAEAGGTLRAAIGGDPDQLDVHTTTSSFAFTILENVYDTLVQPADDLSMEAALAESWEISDDLLTWTFTLREGVLFHDGSEFTADDVVASLERIADEGANSFRLDPVDEYNVVDDLTVELVLNRPAPNLLEQLGPFKGMAIAPAEAIEDGTLQDQPIGTGPFEFVSFTPGESSVIERFDDYWGGAVALDGVDFMIVPDEGTKLISLQAGEVDWIDTVPPEQVDTAGDDENVELSQVASTDYWYMALNHEREPFDDPDVRRAIAYALDIEEITRGARFDAATPNETAIPETSFWYHDYAPFGHDPEQAQQLLDEAGVSDLTLDLMVTNEFPETVASAQVMEAQLGQVGIDVSIRTEDFTTWLADQGDGEFDAFSLSWLGNIDPDDYYYNQHHSEGGFNFHGFADPDVDEALDAARVETDDDARKELYAAAAERIVDQVSYIHLYNPDIVQAWSPEVQGYVTRPDQATRFVDVSLS